MKTLHIGICRICRRSLVSHKNDHTPMYNHSLWIHGEQYHTIDDNYEMFRFKLKS